MKRASLKHSKDHEGAVNKFQEEKDIRIFLISLKAGGVGLNLTAADYVIHYDPWWNPAVEMQASDRAHRIGQTKKVFSYKLISKDSVEEKILKLQQQKKQLVQKLITTEGGFYKSLNKEDIIDLFS
jgi:non-specific serine/threonine protein kinase